jgi:hypothetical protein
MKRIQGTKGARSQVQIKEKLHPEPLNPRILEPYVFMLSQSPSSDRPECTDRSRRRSVG